MVSNDDILAGYRTYLEEFAKDQNWEADLLPYDQHAIPSREGTGGDWLVYHSQADDFVRELLNTINQFRVCIARLSAWDTVLAGRSDAQRVALLLEFVHSLAVVALDSPYKIKNRLVFAACHLCDAANAATGVPARLLPSDGDIGFKTLGPIGGPWRETNTLVDALAGVNADGFRDQTGNFRISEHHRFPRGIELGYPLTFVRMQSAAGKPARRFAIGGPAPLLLADLVPILKAEHRRDVDAFRAFWSLIEEHRSVFRRGPTPGGT